MKAPEQGAAQASAGELSLLLDALTALRRGDAGARLPAHWTGLAGKVADAFNDVVELNAGMADELCRLHRVVGQEGKLKQRASLGAVRGFWGQSIDCINGLIDNLVHPTTEVARVIGAVAQGDLSKSMELKVDGRPLEGEFLHTAQTINKMVEQLGNFSAEVTRVAREVGTEGKLGGQAKVKGVAGTWKDLTDSVNSMAGNLTDQVRNIADVTTAVARGDLSKKIDVDVKGEFLTLRNTINTMVDQLRSFASEVTRVAREVGTEGSLGGQARVEGVSGTWKDLTESVNFMAGNLTSQVRNIAEVTTAVAAGDLSKKITVDVKGEILEVKNTVNTMVDQLRSFAAEVTRVAREVGTEGKLGGQADVQGVAGTWKDLTDSVNLMASNLTSQVRNIADVTKAVAAGNLSEKITVDVKGEILDLKATINTMVDQLSSFAAEVTRVAREVGTEGRLGGQAQVSGVSGTWKDLTDNVNFMAGNLTSQVRGIAKVVSAVAGGDLRQKLTVEAKGEIAALADTINSMTDTLATFADQVTTVAREVGVEGKLGGQAKVPGAAGTWKDLTENVNQLAANLTTQVRAIAEVATAVTQGDLTRSITVQAQGEVAVLKDTINEMIRNLKDTTQKNTEQDWLKTNLAKFSRMLQGQKDLVTVGELILSELAPVVGARQAEFYVLHVADDAPRLRLFASYASSGGRPSYGKEVALGQGLIGQCALDMRRILLSQMPAADFRIATGLCECDALDVLVLPVVFEGQLRGVLELASRERFNPAHQALLDQLTESIGIVINTIEANMRTQDLLTQSQSLAEELQSRQQELQDKARLLAHQNQEVERKNREVEQARQALEEKAEQFALTSRYKSEFLANMSHELRTPLNSLLILSDQLCKNIDGNLSTRQVEFAKTIHSSGNDLLMLINDILDLSKIESGTVVVDASELRLDDLLRSVERSFRHVAESRHLEFTIDARPPLPPFIVTDVKRLQQILKNLLSNAFKFTHRGRVSLSVRMVDGGGPGEGPALPQPGPWLAFEVADTGVGIAPDKQQLIFEAFQQADGSTSRKYGGTGLGLAISRELSQLLGGQIRLVSTPGRGSTFTLVLPPTYNPLRPARHAPPLLPEPAPAAVPGAAEAAPQEELPRGDRPLLVASADPATTAALHEAARQAGLNPLASGSGATTLVLVRESTPFALCLDLTLPDMEGWRVLSHLKADLSVRHLPVCAIGPAEARQRALAAGACAFLAKPLSAAEDTGAALAHLSHQAGPRPRRLLVLLPDTALRTSYLEGVQSDDIEVHVAADTAAACAALADADGPGWDALVLEAGTADSGTLLAALPAVPRTHALPVLVHAPEPGGTPAWQHEHAAFAVHRTRSLETLLCTTALVLHRPLAALPERMQQAARKVHDVAHALAGKKALIVDDDMRNIFALAAVLDAHGMAIVSADNGPDAIAMVRDDPGIDIVLMDSMMPDMDGLMTMREIRNLEAGRNRPMIAVTAKAMKGDREKCIEAGAWDYLSKPVDTDHLLTVLRRWLCN
ncbi:MAG TPA: HAMP domain-containing protein [Burkholderiaceae bacterium]|nr:HAMP domain-containing protein [Burkholderiaceae bacterium]